MSSNINDFWYHVDMAHGSFKSMKSSARTEHKKKRPGAELSIRTNNAGTEALIKVRTDGSYNPGWRGAPFVLRKFTPADHADALALMRTPEWVRPDPPWPPR